MILNSLDVPVVVPGDRLWELSLLHILNESGNFIGQVVGDDKLKIECSFAYMEPVAFQNFLKIWDRKQGGKFVNEFVVFDPRINDFRTLRMYVGDRSGRPYLVNKITSRPTFWVDIKANLIEV